VELSLKTCVCQFVEKRKEMKTEGRTDKELEESYCFLLTDTARVSLTAGIQGSEEEGRAYRSINYAVLWLVLPQKKRRKLYQCTNVRYLKKKKKSRADAFMCFWAVE